MRGISFSSHIAGAFSFAVVALAVIVFDGGFAAPGLGHQRFAPNVARDVAPTPTPGPDISAARRCHDPRTPDLEFTLRDAAPFSVFVNCQVIAYYGYPDVPPLGVLGEESPDEIARQVATMAATYDSVNGTRTAVGAFHLIVAVAQANATPDGSWLYRMPADTLNEWLAAAGRHDLLVILDVQMGHSTVDAEIPRLLKHLDNPRVHLALDPEWAMPPGVAPGDEIGGMDASAINRAQELMAGYIAEHGLSRRMLMVHQFVPQMIRNKPDLRTFTGVDLVVDTDGWGYAEQKVGNYARYIEADGAPHGGFKLFFTQDLGLMSPAEVAALVPQPDVVVYQ